MRVAALDCGTNSLRLLVADVTDGRLTDVRREMRIVRLGQDVDRTGMLAPEALERTRVALTGYAAAVADTGAERIRLVATSATRDARNRDDFAAMVREAIGVDPEVVTGDEEAALSFAGAVGSVPGLTGPVLLVDLGGGSTELVAGSFDGPGGLRARSMDVGSVRMTERHIRHDPPDPAEVAAIEADVHSALARAGRDVPLRDAPVLVGVAGTVTTLAAMILGLDRYESDAIHGGRFTVDQVDGVTRTLLSMTADARAAVPVIHPGRRDVIAAGAVVLRTIVHSTGVHELVASERDILDGIALGIAG